MKKGDKIWVDECPRDNWHCGFRGFFEREDDDSQWFSCPACGWSVTDDEESSKPSDQ